MNRDRRALRRNRRLWDQKRDARLYAGPHPVVAHPPCARWCRLAGLVEARWGHKRGEDDGCFASALASVRKWGGVLEHPAYSDAWAAFLLPAPPNSGGWVRGICGGWACHVEQQRYGHVAKKATWLYAFGVDPLPSLRWGHVADQQAAALVSWCGNHTKAGEKRPRVGKAAAAAAAAATPSEFRDELVTMARSVKLAASGLRPVENLGHAQRSATPPPISRPAAFDREDSKVTDLARGPLGVAVKGRLTREVRGRTSFPGKPGFPANPQLFPTQDQPQERA